MATPAEVAAYLQVPVKTLYTWRYHGKGPRAHRVGRYLRYRWEDVEAWPYVNLAGSSGRFGLALGGQVSGRGTERAASARLRIGETLLTDDTDQHVVLFVTSEPVAAAIATVELLAQDGSVLWRDELGLDE